MAVGITANVSSSEPLRQNPRRYPISASPADNVHTFSEGTKYYTLQVVGSTINALPSSNVRYAFDPSVNLADDDGDFYATLLAGGAHSPPEKYRKSDSITAIYFTGAVGDIFEVFEFPGG